jgi:enoyl-CoA hydratase/carnithine racemase
MTAIVLLERHGSSAILRMNRAEKQNALSRELFEAIYQSLGERRTTPLFAAS